MVVVSRCKPSFDKKTARVPVLVEKEWRDADMDNMADYGIINLCCRVIAAIINEHMPVKIRLCENPAVQTDLMGICLAYHEKIVQFVVRDGNKNVRLLEWAQRLVPDIKNYRIWQQFEFEVAPGQWENCFDSVFPQILVESMRTLHTTQYRKRDVQLFPKWYVAYMAIYQQRATAGPNSPRQMYDSPALAARMAKIVLPRQLTPLPKRVITVLSAHAVVCKETTKRDRVDKHTHRPVKKARLSSVSSVQEVIAFPIQQVTKKKKKTKTKSKPQ